MGRPGRILVEQVRVHGRIPLIDQRLSRGERVDLIGLDGWVLRLVPGVPCDAVRVLPCSLDTR